MNILIVDPVTGEPQPGRSRRRWCRYFDDSIECRRRADFIGENLTGMYSLQFSVGAGQSNGVASLNYLDHLDEFVHWLREQPGVLFVDSISDAFKYLNRHFNGGDLQFSRIPENQELASQYILLYEMSLPMGLGLNHKIDVDKSATRLTVVMNQPTSAELIALSNRAEEWLIENAPQHMQAQAADRTILFAYISQKNMRNLLIGGVIAFGVVAVLLSFALRSWRDGLLSLLPNLLPAAIGFGLWGWAGQTINFGLTIVTVMTLGIVVDDTVYFLLHYVDSRRKGLEPAEAIRATFSAVGRAITITTVALVCGFLVLAQSAFTPNSDMGLLTAIVIAVALVADLLFLPAVLLYTDGGVALGRGRQQDAARVPRATGCDRHPSARLFSPGSR